MSTVIFALNPSVVLAASCYIVRPLKRGINTGTLESRTRFAVRKRIGKKKTGRTAAYAFVRPLSLLGRPRLVLTRSITRSFTTSSISDKTHDSSAKRKLVRHYSSLVEKSEGLRHTPVNVSGSAIIGGSGHHLNQLGRLRTGSRAQIQHLLEGAKRRTAGDIAEKKRSESHVHLTTFRSLPRGEEHPQNSDSSLARVRASGLRA